MTAWFRRHTMKIAFLGLGAMGSRIANRLLDAGTNSRFGIEQNRQPIRCCSKAHALQ